MVIDWEEILMDPVVKGAIITASSAITLASLAGFFKIILNFRDKKLFDEIKKKIGNYKSDTLEEQHDDIRDTIVDKANVIVDKTNNLKEVNTNEFNRIYTKVDRIDREIGANKERTASLDLDQRIIRSNVEKLIYDWERVNLENVELKGRITGLEKKNKELIEVISKSKRRNKGMEI